ncbi:MAG: hypothetical protein JST22_17875 [Bacteroidetes bacterium]|nr:hypothetical protein [Bacteroidota bacterium]
MRKQHYALLLGAALCCSVTGFIACNQQESTPSSPKAGPVSGGGKGGHVLADNCVDFSGSTICGLGKGDVKLGADNVTVSNMTSDDGSDGASSSFSDATAWAQNGQLHVNAAGNNRITFSAVTGGETVSTLALSQQGATTQFDLTPHFTGALNNASSYDIAIYNHGELVANEENVSDGSNAMVIFNSLQDLLMAPPWLLKFYNICKWQLIFENGMPVHTPGGHVVTGDQIDITEHSQLGHYAYNYFQSVNEQGTADSYVITKESTSR